MRKVGRKRLKGGTDVDDERVKELDRENLDLKIANRGKDYLIDEMQKERNGFFDQSLNANQKVSKLETILLALEFKITTNTNNN